MEEILFIEEKIEGRQLFKFVINDDLSILDCAMIMNKSQRKLWQLPATQNIWWNWKLTLRK